MKKALTRTKVRHQERRTTMNKASNSPLTGRKVEHQGRERETESPKDLRNIYSGEDQRRRLQRLHQMLAAPSGDSREKADRNAIENLDGLRTRFTAEIVRFRWIYDGGWEEKVLLINVREIGSKELIRDHFWLTCGKWTQPFSAGDVISFNARIKNRKLQYPTNVRLRTPTNASHPTQGTGDSAIQMEMF